MHIYLLILFILFASLYIVLFVLSGYLKARQAMRAKSLKQIQQEIRSADNFCSLNNISPILLITILSMEDFHFFEHCGYELEKMRRAFVTNIKCMHKYMGGSTITQQLAKNIYFSFRKTYLRKIAELFVAWKLERTFTKEEIFEMYLNIIQYGQGTYNIGDATRHYFGKEPAQIQLNEAITLGSLLPAPSRYNPIADEQLFYKARRLALEKMVTCGILRQKDIVLFEDVKFNDKLSSPIGRVYEQTYTALWFDAIGERKISLPDLHSPLFNRIFNGEMSAKALVDHAERCAALPVRYAFGGLMEQLTPAVIDRLATAYPQFYTAEKVAELTAADGSYGCDCSGLIKTLFFGLNRECYDLFLDRNSKMLYELAPMKGTIGQLPEIAGICLYMPGHTGMYRGKGEVIECTANPRFGNGVVTTRLEHRQWTHWFCCPYIQYPHCS